MFPLRSKEQVTRHTAVCDRSRSEVGNSCHAFYRRPLTMHASQARRRILGHKHYKLPTGRPFFPKNGLRADSIFGQVRDTTVQVWTVREGFGIGSEFRQTCCAANNFRDHEVLLPLVQRSRQLTKPPHTGGETHGIFRTLAISV